MRIHLFPVALAALTLLALACTSGGEPRPGPTETPTPPAATWPVQTGIAPVDAFLNLLASNDFDTIAAHAALLPFECEADRLIMDDPLYCAEGEPDGSVTYGISVGCMPYNSVLTQDALTDRLDWLGDDTIELETVYEADSTNHAYTLAFFKRGVPPAPAVRRTVVDITADGRLAGYASCGEFTQPSGTTVQIWP